MSKKIYEHPTIVNLMGRSVCGDIGSGPPDREMGQCADGGAPWGFVCTAGVDFDDANCAPGSFPNQAPCQSGSDATVATNCSNGGVLGS